MRTKKLVLPIISFALLLGFLFFTNPNKLPLYAVVIPFGLIFLTFSSTIWLVLGQFNLRSRKYMAVALLSGFLPVLLLVLKSIGQLTPRDVVISLAFMVGAALYFSRIKFS